MFGRGASSHTAALTTNLRYDYIFGDVYDINSGLTSIIFVALFIGILLDLILVMLVRRQTNQQLARDGDDGTGVKLNREFRLLFAMYGAPTIPVGLFWQACEYSDSARSSSEH